MDPAFRSDADLDLTAFQSDGNLRQLGYRPSRASYLASSPPLWTSTALRLYFQPLKLLNFDFNADPDLGFYPDADPDPASKNSAEPYGTYLQPWL